MGVTLKYPASGSVTDSVELPWPAHGQQIELDPNQDLYRAASGRIFTRKRGRTRYRITRRFESLTNAQVVSLFDLWEAATFAKNRILYSYFDVETDHLRETPCRIIERPRETRIFRGMHDVELVFEQLTHPDALSDVLINQAPALTVPQNTAPELTAP